MLMLPDASPPPRTIVVDGLPITPGLDAAYAYRIRRDDRAILRGCNVEGYVRHADSALITPRLTCKVCEPVDELTWTIHLIIAYDSCVRAAIEGITDGRHRLRRTAGWPRGKRRTHRFTIGGAADGHTSKHRRSHTEAQN